MISRNGNGVRSGARELEADRFCVGRIQNTHPLPTAQIVRHPENQRLVHPPIPFFSILQKPWRSTRRSFVQRTPPTLANRRVGDPGNILLGEI